MTRSRKFRIVTLTVVVLILLMIAPLLFSPSRPQLGPLDGRLRPCPDKPNCVCTCDADDEHAIEPFAAGSDPQATMQRLRSLLGEMPRVNIVTDDGSYIHAEFTTPLLRFVDDVEFLLDQPAGIIHVRSASRIGQSDFGTNRKRVEMLRDELADR